MPQSLASVFNGNHLGPGGLPITTPSAFQKRSQSVEASAKALHGRLGAHRATLCKGYLPGDQPATLSQHSYGSSSVTWL